MTVFISYRRIDTQQAAGRLADRLMERFGQESVAIDVATDQVGRDYRTVIFESIERAHVVLALVGPRFFVEDASGSRRLDSADDPLRLELARALARREVPVIPVLVDGATLPTREDLPEDVRDLTFRGAVELAHQRFDRDYEFLEAQVARYLEPGSAPEPSVEEPSVEEPGLDETGEDRAPEEVDRPIRHAEVAPTPDEPRTRRWPWIAATAALLALGIGGVILLSGGDTDPPTDAAPTEPPTTATPESTAQSPTSVGTTVPVTSVGGSLVAATTVPPATTANGRLVLEVVPQEIYQQQPDEAVARLEALGFDVRTASSGCSNSTAAGLVRQLTLGTSLNEQIILGKSTDEIDVDAAASLHAGDLLTVWVSTGPC